MLPIFVWVLCVVHEHDEKQICISISIGKALSQLEGIRKPGVNRYLENEDGTCTLQHTNKSFFWFCFVLFGFFFCSTSFFNFFFFGRRRKKWIHSKIAVFNLWSIFFLYFIFQFLVGLETWKSTPSESFVSAC